MKAVKHTESKHLFSLPLLNQFYKKFEGKTVILFATSGGSTIDKANKDFAATYPAIKWKPGKTLNGISKAALKAWLEGL